MAYVWDDKKAAANLKEHDVSFAEASIVFDDPLFVVVADDDHSAAERRFIIMGESSDARLLVVTYAERKTGIRLISAGEATPRERKNYEEEI